MGSIVPSFPTSIARNTPPLVQTNSHTVNAHLVETNSHRGGCNAKGGEYDEGGDPFPPTPSSGVRSPARVYVNVEITHDDILPRRADAPVLFLVVDKILFLVPPRRRLCIIRHDVCVRTQYSAHRRQRNIIHKIYHVREAHSALVASSLSPTLPPSRSSATLSSCV